MPYEESHADYLERMKPDKYGGTPCGPSDCFREIGFDTEMYPGKMFETIFFLTAGYHERLDWVSEDAAHEFIHYWENQIQVVKDYLANGCNPNTHEWKK